MKRNRGFITLILSFVLLFTLAVPSSLVLAYDNSTPDENNASNFTSEAISNEDEATNAEEKTTDEQNIEALLKEAAAPKIETAISAERSTGIAQIQTVIPDYNFAAGVYDSLAAEGHLGTTGESIKAVLASFQGDICANGYIKKMTYLVTARKVTLESFKEEEISETFDTKEEAQSFLDSLVNDLPNYLYAEKALTPQFVQTSEQKPEAELIQDITGIEWLREAKSIDVSFNKISDLMPLSIEHLKSLTPEVGDTDVSEGLKWFGDFGKNTYINFAFNPLRKLPKWIGGRVTWPLLSTTIFELSPKKTIIIRPDEADWQCKLDIEIPLVERDEVRVGIIKNYGSTFINKNTTDAELDYNRLTNEICPVIGLTHSGTFDLVISTDNYSMLGKYSTVEGGREDAVTSGAESMKFKFNQLIRIYTKTETEPSASNTTITLNKTATGTNNPVAGAEFKLYHATLENGKYTKGDLYDDTKYITDVNGQIQFTTELPIGNYCFVESKAPDGFQLDDTTTIGFTVAGGAVTLTGGEPTVTPTDGEETNAGENATYIDRYSPDVNVTITPEDGCTLDKILITYFDRETQENKIQEVSTAQEASDWINQNKGNTDELGVIDGTVKVRAVFKQSVSLAAQNERTNTLSPDDPSTPDTPENTNTPDAPDAPKSPEVPGKPNSSATKINPNTDVPQTGDTTNLGVLIVALGSSGLLAVVLIKRRKRNV